MSNFPILDLFGPVIKKVRKDPKKLLIFRVVGGTVEVRKRESSLDALVH